MVVPRQQLVEGLAPDKFHYDVGHAPLWFLAHIEDGYYSRMRQAARSLRFAKETLAILAFLFRGLTGQRNGLYGDDSVDLGIARFVDNTHGSPPQLGEDLVAPKTFAPAIIHAAIIHAAIIHRCHLRFPSLVVTSCAGRRLLLVIRRGNDKRTDYVLVDRKSV